MTSTVAAFSWTLLGKARLGNRSLHKPAGRRKRLLQGLPLTQRCFLVLASRRSRLRNTPRHRGPPTAQPQQSPWHWSPSELTRTATLLTPEHTPPRRGHEKGRRERLRQRVTSHDCAGHGDRQKDAPRAFPQAEACRLAALSGTQQGLPLPGLCLIDRHQAPRGVMPATLSPNHDVAAEWTASVGPKARTTCRHE